MILGGPKLRVLKASRDVSSQLVSNLNRAAELITLFKQVAADRNYSDQRTFDLGDLTEQVVLSLRPGLRKHNLTLTVDCEPNLTMNSYPGPYGQVLTNLFLNAVAHAFPDGKPGALDIKVREPARTMSRFCFRTMAAACRSMFAAVPSIRSLRRAAIRAAPGSACISSTAS